MTLLPNLNSGARRALGLALACTLAFAGSAHADGSAVFASVSNSDQQRSMAATLKDRLHVDIRTSEVWVDGVNWIRLHSPVLAEPDARALVDRARALGYSAWYNSSGNRWASRASESPAPLASDPVDSDARYRARYQPSSVDVTPATDDLSHLPMAETLPLESPR